MATVVASVAARNASAGVSCDRRRRRRLGDVGETPRRGWRLDDQISNKKTRLNKNPFPELGLSSP